MTEPSDPIQSRIRHAFADPAQHRYHAGFADRTVARWRDSRAAERPFARTLDRQFRRLAIAALAATLLLAFYNVSSPIGAGSAMERVLGLTPLSLDAAYSLSLSGTP